MQGLFRTSGILMPISSLPSSYGIGTLGKAAFDFVDFLHEAKQSYWQLLPVGPTSYGDSPYQSLSSSAGNPYFVDPEKMVEEGLLTKEELRDVDWGNDEEAVDYGRIYEGRYRILKMAFDRGRDKDMAAQKHFLEENADWVRDYAFYMALKRRFEMKAWYEWPEDIRLRKAEAMASYQEELKDDIELFIYIQYLFDKQWSELKAYAEKNDIRIIGDLPIYVAMDSVEVWAEPKWFCLDENNVPTEVSGVPGDYFCADGQLWGNPLYRYDAMEEDGFDWWIRRVKGSLRLYDVLRIDHFRGLESFWAVPYGAPTAKEGRWIKGPGMKLVKPLIDTFGQESFIAEDLGFITPEVRKLLDDSGFPGMKVLELGFGVPEAEDHRMEKFTPHSICYTGTHDNETLMGFLETADPEAVEEMKEYFHIEDAAEPNFVVLDAGMNCRSNLFIAQMQDYLGLGHEARINTPSTTGCNWKWRMKKGAADEDLARRIAKMTVRSGRAV